MINFKKSLRRSHLAILFALIVFCIITLTFFVILLGIMLIQKYGIVIGDDKQIPIVIFIGLSIFIGTICSFIFSKKLLEPLCSVADAADKIAEGDYSVRIYLKGPDEISRLSESFNHMAEELGSVEIFRTDFINNFSHEFKTPIVSIRGFAKILKRGDISEDERNEYLDIIIRESERLVDLSSNVLYLSKLENQIILTDIKLFNVSEQIRQVIIILDGKWYSKELDYEFDCCEIYVHANEELLKQVWINLLDNAMKFSSEKSTIKINIVQNVETVLVSICNKGIGVSDDASLRIFDKFYQEDKSHKTLGNGLGLAIVKRIVELHDGSVSMKKEGDDEIIFDVIIPSVGKVNCNK